MKRSTSALGRDSDAVRWERDVALSKRCTWRCGGVARWWATAESADGVLRVLESARDRGLPLYPVGLGSNTLFPDGEVDAIFLRLGGELARIELVTGAGAGRVRVGCGAVNAHFVRAALGAGLIGAEFLRLVPGTIGGALATNAGTKEAEIGPLVESVELLEESGAGGWGLVERSQSACGFGYRASAIGRGSIALRATLALWPGDVERAAERAAADKARRERTQPYRLASAGSTFANPEGDWAGRLIEAAGLKGARRGGARISELHANFFLNEGGARSADFIELMARARFEVRQRFGVELRPEVRFIGFDGMRALERAERERAWERG